MSNFKQYVNMYTFDTTLPGSGEKIVFRPITTGQLKKILLFETSQDPDVMEKALDSIANECVIEPKGFNIEKLYLQDRFYLLLEIRKATKGSKYSFQTTCTSCGSQSQQTISLGELPVVRLESPVKQNKTKKSARLKEVKEGEEPESIKNDWNVMELDKNISIRLGYVTREMQRMVVDKVNSVKELTEMQRSVETSTSLFAAAILEVITPAGVENNLSLEDKQYIIDNIPQNNLERIADWYEKHDFGVKFSFKTKCIHCGKEDIKEIPLENFFF